MADSKNKALPAGTLLRGGVYTYTIEKVLGQGSFGITYLASTLIKGPLGDLSLPVAVKEFFAKDLDSRGEGGTVSARTEDGVAYRYAKAFQRESQNLSKLKHPGIVKVLEAFQANGTYYYSMEYLSGGSLDDKVKGVGISEEEALPMIAKIGDALAFMHGRKMMHLDLKPKNIMLKADGTPVIIDFGLSKQYDDNGEPESSSTIGLGTPGYAPLEQANRNSGRLFQSTLDIYALGATLYKMLTGITPPDASSILDDGLPESELKSKGVSDRTITAIRNAMHPGRKNRTPAVEDFLSMLEGKSVEPEDEVEDETEPKPVPKPIASHAPAKKPSVILSGSEESKGKPRPKTWLWALLGGLAVTAAFIFGGKSRSQGAGGDLGADTLAVAPAKPIIETPISPPVNEPVPEAPGSINGHEWVDLGLPSGLKWATCNVGASAPEEDGDYFAWGETRPKNEYTWENYKFRVSGDSFVNVTYSKYNTKSKSGTVDNKTRLDLSDDAARVNWGGSWRMPTKAEQDELLAKCTWAWTTQGGKKGYKVTGENGISIFLPVAGYWIGASLYYASSYGDYWSSSLRSDDPDGPYCLHFSSGTVDWISSGRYYGFPVRPVSE